MHKYIVCLILFAGPLKGCCYESEYRPTKEEKARICRLKMEEAKHKLATNQTNEIPYILFSSDEHIALARQYLEQGADPHLLSGTANKLCVETTRLLLEFNADPNYQAPYSNYTPLHVLALTYNKKPGSVEKKITIAKLLLLKKAQLHLKDHKHKTPLECALCCYHNSGGIPYLGFEALAKLLGSESRYRLLFEIEAPRKHNLPSPFNRLPKDLIKEIVLLVYPKMSGCS